MFDRRLYFALAVFFVGGLAVQDVSRQHEKETVTPVPSSVPIGAIPSTGFPPVSPTESARMETSSVPGQATTTSKHHHERFFNSWEEHNMDSGADDWDYMEDLFKSSSELTKILQQEMDRHPEDSSRAQMPTRPPLSTTTTTVAPPHRGAGHAHGRDAHQHAHPRPPALHTRARQAFPRIITVAPPPSWVQFCQEAAVEDEQPFRVGDGSFHPRYEEVPGVGVYRLHARPRPWEEARRVCEREGAQLAVPKSRAEALALAEIHNRCPRLLPTHFNDYQYLGVHDLYSEGDWETVVGTPLNETGYMVWGRNQPDNAHHHGENCLSMNRNGFFNDVPCWTELPFICEHP